ncbi:MAG: ABC transporter substrate-binding protein [Deinococcota bacterium]|jgi:branched-chain amino acid transport system substrate-binding protein|nr:ABC transporter substrate-binding protein [Deinococcota bacterium]
MRAFRLLVLLFGTLGLLGNALAEPVRIGMVTTLSTGGGYLGDHVRKGFELAVEMRSSPIELELFVEDDAQNPEQAVQLVDRLVEREGVRIMTGVIFSNVAMATVPRLVRRGVVYVSPNAGPSDLAGRGCHPNYFNVAWQNDNLHEAMGQYVGDEGYDNVYILAPNYPAGQDALNGFKRYYSGGLAGEVYTQFGQTDYAAEISALRAAQPDAVFFFYPGGMGINFVRQYAQAGLLGEIPLFGSAFSFDDTLLDAVGEAAVGTFNTSQWSPDLDNPANQAFVAAYRERYGEYPTLYSSQGFDTANLILSALEQVNGNIDDTEALIAALREADFDSVRGAFRFGPNHHPIQNIYLREVYVDENDNVTNRLAGTIFEDHQDAYAADCQMP